MKSSSQVNDADPVFVHIGLDSNAQEDDLYAIDQLMRCVGSELLGDAYYHDLGARIDARRKPDYKPQVDRTLVRKAWELLKTKEWIGLQNVNAERKLRSLKPLAGLVNATAISAGGNLIEDIEPLRGLPALKTLYLSGNPVRDITPLADCLQLRRVELSDTAVTDLSPLKELPELQELEVDAEVLPTCGELRALRYLKMRGSEIPAASFPKLRKLQSLDGPLSDLAGLGGCESLQNLSVSSSQQVLGLEALKSLRKLTHLRIQAEASAVDLTPLSHALALRKVTIFAREIAGRDALDSLPALREAHLVLPNVKYADSSMPLENRGWEAEFKADRPLAVPSLQLEIVSESEFERFNTQDAYGVGDWDGNRDMLSSERGWLLGEIEASLRVDWTEEDVVLPWKGGFRRSDTVCIYSEAAAEQVRTIVTRIQNCLLWARNPWIIYFQSSFWEGDLGAPDFVSWVYPDRIVTTRESLPALEQWLNWQEP